MQEASLCRLSNLRITVDGDEMMFVYFFDILHILFISEKNKQISFLLFISDYL